ncbi:MAG: HAD-IB family phosphatase [Patescibacteria group bacterium]
MLKIKAWRPKTKVGAQKLKFKNFVFDCDSTLTQVEGLDELASIKGLNGQVCALTKFAMDGFLTFNESFVQRVDLIKPTQKELEDLALKYMQKKVRGVGTLVTLIKKRGGNVFILSGGIKTVLDIFGRHIGVPDKNIFGCELSFLQNGEFGGLVENGLFLFGKAAILKKIAATGPTVFVGDGFNDLEAANACDLFIGFGGVVERAVVKKTVKNYYSGKDLTGLMAFFV